jgi:uncharacterized protein YjbI with pentapeptide repeats
MADPIVGASYTDEDWYGEDLADRSYLTCTFAQVDLTEATSRGAVFEECTFSLVRLNASRHEDSAFLRCSFVRCDLFDAELTGCKLTGSTFTESTLRPLRVTGGDWSFVGLAGADLRGVTIKGTRMREVDLTGARCAGAVISDVDLSGAQLRGADISGCDLRGSDLSALDPTAVTLAGTLILAEQALTVARTLGFDIR